MKKRKLTKSGSIAITSILIISAILLIIVTGMTDKQVTTSYQYLNNYSDKTSYYQAETCLEEAIIRIEEDTSYTGGTITLSDPETNCSITVSGSSLKTITISVSYDNYTQDFQGTATVTTQGQANNVSLSSWEQI